MWNVCLNAMLIRWYSSVRFNKSRTQKKYQAVLEHMESKQITANAEKRVSFKTKISETKWHRMV